MSYQASTLGRPQVTTLALWGSWKSSCLFLIRKHSLGKSGPEPLVQILGSFPLIPYHLLNFEVFKIFFTLYTNFVIWLPKKDWSKWPSLKLLEAKVFFFVIVLWSDLFIDRKDLNIFNNTVPWFILLGTTVTSHFSSFPLALLIYI